MNGIEGKDQSGRPRNRLSDTMVTIIKVKKRRIDHVIYMNSFYDRTVSYLRLSTDDVLNTTNNEIQSPELT